MNIGMRGRVLSLLAATVLVVTACSGDGGSTTTTTSDSTAMPDVIRFGVTPADDSAGQEERFGAMVKALEEDLGTDVEFITTGGSYGGLIEALGQAKGDAGRISAQHHAALRAYRDRYGVA